MIRFTAVLLAMTVALVAGTIITIWASKINHTESVRVIHSTWGEYGHGLVVEGRF